MLTEVLYTLLAEMELRVRVSKPSERLKTFRLESVKTGAYVFKIFLFYYFFLSVLNLKIGKENRPDFQFYFQKAVTIINANNNVTPANLATFFNNLNFSKFTKCSFADSLISKFSKNSIVFCLFKK